MSHENARRKCVALLHPVRSPLRSLLRARAQTSPTIETVTERRETLQTPFLKLLGEITKIHDTRRATKYSIKPPPPPPSRLQRKMFQRAFDRDIWSRQFIARHRATGSSSSVTDFPPRQIIHYAITPRYSQLRNPKARPSSTRSHYVADGAFIRGHRKLSGLP